MASGLIHSSLAAVIENIPSQSNQSLQLKAAAQQLLDTSIVGDDEMARFDEFSETVVSYLREKISEVTKDVCLNSSKRTKIWAEFHRIRLNTSGLLHSAWDSLHFSDNSLLMQSVYDEIYSLLVKEYFNAKSQSSPSAALSLSGSTVTHTEDELNAMRYACGYTPRVLLKKYETRNGNVYSQYVHCLGNMAVEREGDDLLSYTRKWLAQANRGGLFTLNNNSFSLFIEIERCVRILLPQRMIQNDNDKASFKKSLHDRISREKNIQFYWSMLSEEIEEEKHSEALLEEIISLWVTIRGFSLTASWMEEYKINKQRTIQKATGLHKSIS